jgi:hypothetical protein
MRHRGATGLPAASLVGEIVGDDRRHPTAGLKQSLSRRSLGASILARTLRDRRVLLRKNVEPIEPGPPRWVVGVRRPTASPAGSVGSE